LSKERREKVKQVLQLIEEIINSEEKVWNAGKDWVHYSGPYFDSKEYTNTVKTLLDGWLVLGAKGSKFERLFCKQYNKPYGILTNSGSSANLLMMASMASRRLYNFPKGT
jgi:CDP-6-deoxy-D-xylo-4-hexulose-3-dehydrase